MKPIRIENGIVIYYGNLVDHIRNGQTVVDLMSQVPELREFLERQRNVNKIRWQDGIFDQLASGQGETREVQNLKNCRVWQLKPEADIYRKLIGYDALIQKFGIFNPEDCRLVSGDTVDTNNLEALYTGFSADHPVSYVRHSLFMSDVLELYDESGSFLYYLDSFDFKQVDFRPPNREIAHIQTT